MNEKESLDECYYFADKDSLIKSIKDIIRDEDVILIKGSRGNFMEDIINYI
jgi:UDP-N-acetylmuramyl pentapeptide synthase